MVRNGSYDCWLCLRLLLGGLRWVQKTVCGAAHGSCAHSSSCWPLVIFSLGFFDSTRRVPLEGCVIRAPSAASCPCAMALMPLPAHSRPLSEVGNNFPGEVEGAAVKGKKRRTWLRGCPCFCDLGPQFLHCAVAIVPTPSQIDQQSQTDP